MRLANEVAENTDTFTLRNARNALIRALGCLLEWYSEFEQDVRKGLDLVDQKKLDPLRVIKYL